MMMIRFLENDVSKSENIRKKDRILTSEIPWLTNAMHKILLRIFSENLPNDATFASCMRRQMPISVGLDIKKPLTW